MQMDIGLLAACFKVPGQGYASCYCTIQLYEEMNSFGSGFFNEYDCPLYTLTDTFRCVSSDSICRTVSVLHECTSSCLFKTLDTETQVERETVTSNTLVFEHDYSNTIYSKNVYCMHQCKNL